MRIERLILTAYGRCRDVGIDIGDGVTVVLGANEAGKSTSLDALGDFLWGIPKLSSRTSEFTRSQLRIDAVVRVDGESTTVVRKSTGLFDEDLVTEFPPPWNPTNQLTATWWRTRLGINHAELRRGGAEVFTGSGDIADIIFSAREGRSAREVLKEITEQADRLFKPDRRAKRVQLRLAMDDYKKAVGERDGRLTRAGEVTAQRESVQELAARRGRLRDAATVTAQALKREEENLRIIGHVLKLRRATGELDAIDQQGDRLTPDALGEYQRAGAASRSAQERITKLDSALDAKTRTIEELRIDDRLLDDRETFGRLQPDVNVRIEDLRRAGEEFGVAAAEAATGLEQLLESIGVGVETDLDAAVAAARVRDDHAATLNDLADRLEGLDQKRQAGRDEYEGALGELLAKGITVDLATATAPNEQAIDTLRKTLIGARNAEDKAETLFAEATAAVQALQASAADPHPGASLTHRDVAAARSDRDTRWGVIRRSWVAGELPVPAERVDLAAEFDTALAAADRVADDEATERAHVAALDARTTMRVEGFDAARQKQQDAAAHLGAAADDRHRAQAQWAAAWTTLGITAVPEGDSSAMVAERLTAVHAGRAREQSAVEQIAELDDSWCAAAELAGLAATTTCAAWRRRAQVIEEIEAVNAQRTKDREREAQARGKWEDFTAEATALLQRHALIEPDQSVTPAVIEQGFAQLGRQLDAAREAATRRATYLEQVAEMRAELDDARQAQLDTAAVLRRLVETYRVDTEQDLAVLAERAERAAEPLGEQGEATKGIKNGLDPGTELHDAVDRLAGHDSVTVEQAVADATGRDEEARKAADHALSEYSLASERLAELEAAAGAADAEAVVVARQAEVAGLAEAWTILALQRKLLEDVLDRLGSGDTRPLLDHAGQLLDRLTDGRWVALRAEDDGTSRTLRVIRADNTPFETGQLSEGTADQVFFALRLAAVAELHNERLHAGDVPLPLVLDDVLMAFDEARVHSALNILLSLAPGLQVIVFTHHRHVAEAAGELAQITVSRLPAATAIADPLAGELIRAQA